MALLPEAVRAHDAFGGLGPFYANVLHLLADPAQGLVIAALAVFLARQPLASAQAGFAALAASVLAATLAVHLGLAGPHALRVSSLTALLLAILALSGLPLGRAISAIMAAAAGLAAGFSTELPTSTARAAALAELGGVVGLCLGALFIWGGVAWLQDRLSRIPGAVAAAWIVAVGLMALALPVA